MTIAQFEIVLLRFCVYIPLEQLICAIIMCQYRNYLSSRPFSGHEIHIYLINMNDCKKSKLRLLRKPKSVIISERNKGNEEKSKKSKSDYYKGTI